MSRNSSAESALYLAWKTGSAEDAQERLAHGAGLNLYTLRSWVIANGEARALIAPAAPLEEIAEAIWDHPRSPVSSRWIAGQRACSSLVREMETMPVSLGLVARPEQWRFSSAAER